MRELRAVPFPEGKNQRDCHSFFAIAEGLKPLEVKGWEIVTASLNDPDQGISDELLDHTEWALLLYPFVRPAR